MESSDQQQQQEQEQEIHQVASVMWKYPPLVLLALCWFGNSLSFLVMSRPAMRDNSVSVYLRFIALTDIATTTVGLGPRVAQEWAGVAFEEVSDAACKAHRFLLFGCGDLAIWCLTVLTVDRLIIVKLPLKAKTWCSKRRALKVCACIVVAGVAKNLSSLWSRGERWELLPMTADEATALNVTVQLQMTAKCGQVPQFDFFENYIRSWLGFTTYFFGPLLVIAVSNTLIVKQLVRSRKLRMSMQEGSTQQQQQQQPQKQQDADSDTNSSMTRMMLAVTLMYVILITPSISMYISAPYWPSRSPFPTWQEFAFAATDVLVYSNHTMNFFMYVLSGQRFRSELGQLFCCGGPDKRLNSTNSHQLSRSRQMQQSGNNQV